MASLRIKFPEKEEPSVIALNGSRITIGRLPDNTIQIVDRVISSTHAELMFEGDHYHLRDLNSTNGTFVNGQFVTDYHLREACTIAFGTVECDFDPAAVASGAGVEALPTRAELNSLKQENEKLTTQVSALREELDALRKVRPMTGDEAALAVPKAEYERVTADREALKEAQERHHQEIARLKENLALLRRDRENLQRAWEITKAELTAYRPVGSASPAGTTARLTALKAVPVANPPVAKTPGSPLPSPAPAAPPAPSPSPAPAAPSAPSVPSPRPVPAAPSAPGVPAVAAARPAVPGAPTVKATPRPAVAVPAAAAKPTLAIPTTTPKPVGTPTATPQQQAKKTQKMEPDTKATPLPTPLPKPVVKLGSGITRAVPRVIAKPPSATPPSATEGSES
jgi:pSer/pThr/pTyr-binding forkhead associated (FHA) protein